MASIFQVRLLVVSGRVLHLQILLLHCMFLNRFFCRVTIRPCRIIPQRWYNKHTTTHVRMYISKLEFHTQDVKMSNETKLRDNSEESFSHEMLRCQSRNQKSLKHRLPKISTTSHWFRKILWSNQPAFWCWVLPKLPKQWNFPVDVVKVKKTIPCIKTRIDSGYPLSSQGVGNCICVLFTNIHTLAASRGEHFEFLRTFPTKNSSSYRCRKQSGP